MISLYLLITCCICLFYFFSSYLAVFFQRFFTENLGSRSHISQADAWLSKIDELNLPLTLQPGVKFQPQKGLFLVVKGLCDFFAD